MSIILWTILAILIIFYLLGFVTGTGGQYIHLTLIPIVGLIAYYIVRERRKANR